MTPIILSAVEHDAYWHRLDKSVTPEAVLALCAVVRDLYRLAKGPDADDILGSHGIVLDKPGVEGK